ncbi:nucleolar protein dao-5-like [Ornithodoros turicata]|uniref:nucleolar protein dao-5-like n=1 Tax=Ornithodoros turicata TaxID=34597 RepID=UPI003139BD17
MLKTTKQLLATAPRRVPGSTPVEMKCRGRTAVLILCLAFAISDIGVGRPDESTRRVSTPPRNKDEQKGARDTQVIIEHIDGRGEQANASYTLVDWPVKLGILAAVILSLILCLVLLRLPEPESEIEYRRLHSVKRSSSPTEGLTFVDIFDDDFSRSGRDPCGDAHRCSQLETHVQNQESRLGSDQDSPDSSCSGIKKSSKAKHISPDTDFGSGRAVVHHAQCAQLNRTEKQHEAGSREITNCPHLLQPEEVRLHPGKGRGHHTPHSTILQEEHHETFAHCTNTCVGPSVNDRCVGRLATFSHPPRGNLTENSATRTTESQRQQPCRQHTARSPVVIAATSSASSKDTLPSGRPALGESENSKTEDDTPSPGGACNADATENTKSQGGQGSAAVKQTDPAKCHTPHDSKKRGRVPIAHKSQRKKSSSRKNRPKGTKRDCRFWSASDRGSSGSAEHDGRADGVPGSESILKRQSSSAFFSSSESGPAYTPFLPEPSSSGVAEAASKPSRRRTRPRYRSTAMQEWVPPHNVENKPSGTKQQSSAGTAKPDGTLSSDRHVTPGGTSVEGGKTVRQEAFLPANAPGSLQSTSNDGYSSSSTAGSTLLAFPNHAGPPEGKAPGLPPEVSQSPIKASKPTSSDSVLKPFDIEKARPRSPTEPFIVEHLLQALASKRNSASDVMQKYTPNEMSAKNEREKGEQSVPRAAPRGRSSLATALDRAADCRSNSINYNRDDRNGSGKADLDDDLRRAQTARTSETSARHDAVKVQGFSTDEECSTENTSRDTHESPFCGADHSPPDRRLVAVVEPEEPFCWPKDDSSDDHEQTEQPKGPPSSRLAEDNPRATIEQTNTEDSSPQMSESLIEDVSVPVGVVRPFTGVRQHILQSRETMLSADKGSSLTSEHRNLPPARHAEETREQHVCQPDNKRSSGLSSSKMKSPRRPKMISVPELRRTSKWEDGNGTLCCNTRDDKLINQHQHRPHHQGFNRGNVDKKPVGRELCDIRNVPVAAPTSLKATPLQDALDLSAREDTAERESSSSGHSSGSPATSSGTLSRQIRPPKKLLRHQQEINDQANTIPHADIPPKSKLPPFRRSSIEPALSRDKPSTAECSATAKPKQAKRLGRTDCNSSLGTLDGRSFARSVEEFSKEELRTIPRSEKLKKEAEESDTLNLEPRSNPIAPLGSPCGPTDSTSLHATPRQGCVGRSSRRNSGAAPDAKAPQVLPPESTPP